jgi:hypothetical protein
LELHVCLVSRCVYILLYILAIARVALHVIEMRRVQAGDNPHLLVAYVRPLDDFRFYIAICPIPLWSIRALVLFSARKLKCNARIALTVSK